MSNETLKHKAQRTVLKQSAPRLWLGALRDMIQRTQSYYSIINISLLLIATYTLREATIKKYFPDFNFFWLLAILAVFVIVVALLDYKFVYPSQIAFHQHEAWKHRSMVRKDTEAMKSQIRSLRRDVKVLRGEDLSEIDEILDKEDKEAKEDTADGR